MPKKSTLSEEDYAAYRRMYRAEWARNKRAENPELDTKQNESYLKKREDMAGRERPVSCELCGSAEKLMNGVSRAGRKFSRSNIVFDHCHSCGDFRGWICSRCNTVLGLVDDSPNLLMAMSDYLMDKKCQ